MACQEVPQDLLNMAMMDPNFKKGRGNPRKGFGRGDEKLRPGLGADSASSVCTKSFKECSITSNVPCICSNAVGYLIVCTTYLTLIPLSRSSR